MALKNPAWYRESLRDGRVTYIQGEQVPDITQNPWFDVPIANTAEDYVYDDPRPATSAPTKPRTAPSPIASSKSPRASRTWKSASSSPI